MAILRQFLLFFCRLPNNVSISKNNVVEAVEVIKAAKVLRPEKSQLITSESSRFLNLALFGCFEKQIFSVRIMKCQVEFTVI